MKIMHLNSFDSHGGAARAAYRLHRGLRGLSVESIMLVQSKAMADDSIIGPAGKFQKLAAFIQSELERPLTRFLSKGLKDVFSSALVSFISLDRVINAKKIDIVHLHWVNNGMLRLEQLGKINQQIVWTMHDMWPFTGGCHHSDECKGYQEACGNCPKLKSPAMNDLSASVYRRKAKSWAGVDFTIIAPSSWMAEKVKESSLFKDVNVKVIPNGLDTQCFKPHDKVYARSALGLPEFRQLILFGAISPLDPGKGYQLLMDALGTVNGDFELVIFGEAEMEDVSDCGFPVTLLGHISDDTRLSLLYSAVDVMVVPSRYESFGQTAVESLSCETPVVAFAATGLLDIVDHKKNGYLAEPYSSDDLASGIEWVLSDPDRNIELAKSAREKVLRTFDINIVSRKHQELYSSLMIGTE